ncbi:hypothetical protein HJG60_011359 [Phyllostomus discolor]|uniref:Uncharacterized protein n=1 Tax=Phyllostomus discolor TaxID=89673 RepID=A0A834A4P6_9CHIR|nr:hypothetical protein HJG60_011359 [Phyllostomus discolor]
MCLGPPKTSFLSKYASVDTIKFTFHPKNKTNVIFREVFSSNNFGDNFLLHVFSKFFFVFSGYNQHVPSSFLQSLRLDPTVGSSHLLLLLLRESPSSLHLQELPFRSFSGELAEPLHSINYLSSPSPEVALVYSLLTLTVLGFKILLLVLHVPFKYFGL